MKMETHTTAGPVARPPVSRSNRPLGGRKLTNRHATADWCARQFKPKPDFDRFEAVQILEEIGSQIPADLLMTPQLIAHLRLLPRWGIPMPFGSQRFLCWCSAAPEPSLVDVGVVSESACGLRAASSRRPDKPCCRNTQSSGCSGSSFWRSSSLPKWMGSSIRSSVADPRTRPTLVSPCFSSTAPVTSA